jgi:hypothetical protein
LAAEIRLRELFRDELEEEKREAAARAAEEADKYKRIADAQAAEKAARLQARTNSMSGARMPGGRVPCSAT